MTTSPQARHDSQIDWIQNIRCGRCAQTVPDGAHIVCHPASPDLHVMYCPDHCPCTGWPT